MINLALYSDQIIPENAAVDVRLLAMLKARGAGTRIGYVASGPEPGKRFFHERKIYYARCGLDLAAFHEAGTADAGVRNALFACDAIHLSGGHTGGFLRRLRGGALLDPLRDWALAGGVLIGTSAGALLMTPTIAADALFSGNRPEEVQNGAALGLVPFEFFPHLNGNAAYLPALIRYSRFTPRPILACNDGAGVVASGGRVACIGRSVWIEDGAVQPASRIRLAGLSVEPAP